MRRQVIWTAALLSAAMLVGGVPVGADEQGDAAPKREQRDGDADKRDARSREERRDEMRRRIHEQLFKGIELTQEQREKLEALREEARAKAKAWREEHKDDLQAIRQEMRGARKAGDKEKAQAAREKLQALMKDAPNPRDHHDAVRAVLTEEQVKQFDSNLAELRERWEKRRQERAEGGEGRKDGDEDKGQKKDEGKPNDDGDAALDL